ncbi:MAG: hypothetical protein GY800_13710 [Planctomycetes bacterium]|nr:hypothetical protein [Planctomycetota bacterium]
MKLITAPATEPLSLADAKEHLIIDDDLHNTLISSAITAAREYVEEYTGRALVSQTREMAFDSFPDEIDLSKMPVLSITSIKYYDTDDTEQTMDSGDYVLDDYSLNHRVICPDGWPSTNGDTNNVKVRYIAGYETVPEPVVWAIKLLVGDAMENREETVIGVSVTPTKTAQMLLAPYRILRV